MKKIGQNDTFEMICETQSFKARILWNKSAVGCGKGGLWCPLISIWSCRVLINDLNKFIHNSSKGITEFRVGKARIISLNTCKTETMIAIEKQAY